MKLYIATTTLNFDTIMSTESISPMSFYSLRRFGIPYMYDKVSLCLPNSILLMDFIPEFSINRKDYDHRALIIEIDTECYPNGYFREVKKGIYQTSKTIYLSPQSSSIIFLNYEDYTITLNKSANILETKCGIYEKAKRIGVVRQPCRKIYGDFFDGIEDIDKIDEEALRRDKLINKAKGFLTGYLIGRGKSLTTESARLLNITRQIKNLIYSLATKEGEDRNRIHQDLRLLVSEANQLSWMLDDNKVKVSCAINEDLKAFGFNDDETLKVKKYLSKRGLYSALIGQLCSSARLFNIEQVVSAAANAPDDLEMDRQLKKFTDYTNSIIKYINDEQSLNSLIKFHPDLKLIECLDGKIDEESRKIVPIIYNLFSDQNIRGEEFKGNRINHIVDIANVLKNSDEINFQLIREYINGLLDNLEKVKPFDVTSSEFIAINSFGAFVKAPDADIEKLSSILVSNEISDYRIALGLWGIIYGYSNIPNQYFRQWVNQSDDTEIQQYLNIINTQIYGGNTFPGQNIKFEQIEEIPEKEPIALQGQLSKDTTNKEPSLFEDIEDDSETIESIDSIERGRADIENSNLGGPLKAREESTSIGCLLAEISKTAEEVLNEEMSKTNKSSANISYYIDAIEDVLHSSDTIDSAVHGIEQIKTKRGTKDAWKNSRRKIIEAIEGIETSVIEGTQKATREAHAAMYGIAPSTSFLYDNNRWEYIVNIIPNDSVLKEQFKKDLEWFINNYQERYLEKGQWVEGRFWKREHSNSAILEHLREYLKGKKMNNKQSWLVEKYSSLSIDNLNRLIDSLKYKYK